MQAHRYIPDLMAQGDCRVCGHVQQADHHRMAEWKPIKDAPQTGDQVVCDARTGSMEISSYENLDWRRGWRHRNGFPATHFLDGVPPLPAPEPEE